MHLTDSSIARWLDQMRANAISENTMRAYRSDLYGYIDWLDSGVTGSPPENPSDLEDSIKRYLNHGRVTWAAKTTERKLGAFRSWGRFAGLAGFLSEYKPPKAARPTPHPMPEGMAGVASMLAAIPDTDTGSRTRALVALCGLCGLRVGEAVAAAPKDLNLVERTILVHGKGNVERNVPLSDAALRAILPAFTLASVNGGTIIGVQDRRARDIIKRLGLDAGLEREISSHDLRATLATSAYQGTKDLRAVQELLGHASSRTTEVYTGISETAMRDAVEKAASSSQNLAEGRVA